MSYFTDKFQQIYTELQKCDEKADVVIRTNDTYIVWCLMKGRLEKDKPNAEIVNAINDFLCSYEIVLHIDFTGRTERMFGETLELYEYLARDCAKLDREHLTIDVQRDFAWGGSITIGKMGLDWQDVRDIVKIADDVLTRETKYHFANEKEYYEQVLQRLKAGARKQSFDDL